MARPHGGLSSLEGTFGVRYDDHHVSSAKRRRVRRTRRTRRLTRHPRGRRRRCSRHSSGGRSGRREVELSRPHPASAYSSRDRCARWSRCGVDTLLVGRRQLRYRWRNRKLSRRFVDARHHVGGRCSPDDRWRVRSVIGVHDRSDRDLCSPCDNPSRGAGRSWPGLSPRHTPVAHVRSRNRLVQRRDGRANVIAELYCHARYVLHPHRRQARLRQTPHRQGDRCTRRSRRPRGLGVLVERLCRSMASAGQRLGSARHRVGDPDDRWWRIACLGHDLHDVQPDQEDEPRWACGLCGWCCWFDRRLSLAADHRWRNKQHHLGHPDRSGCAGSRNRLRPGEL